MIGVLLEFGGELRQLIEDDKGLVAIAIWVPQHESLRPGRPAVVISGQNGLIRASTGSAGLADGHLRE
jgi:hypothetical protein